MKAASMLVDVLGGLRRSPVTERIPAAPPPRLRGRLHWTPEGCTGCALCVKDCPADALDLIRLDETGKHDDKGKHFVMRYSLESCTFCGQCVENCRFDCIRMEGEAWSLAAAARDGFTIYYGEDADVQHVMAGSDTDSSQPDAAKGRHRRDRA